MADYDDEYDLAYEDVADFDPDGPPLPDDEDAPPDDDAGWRPDPADDRQVVEAICDRLHVHLATPCPQPGDEARAAVECVVDLIAILHTSPVADFGSAGDACVGLRDARTEVER